VNESTEVAVETADEKRMSEIFAKEPEPAPKKTRKKRAKKVVKLATPPLSTNSIGADLYAIQGSLSGIVARLRNLRDFIRGTGEKQAEEVSQPVSLCMVSTVAVEDASKAHAILSELEELLLPRTPSAPEPVSKKR
jgi:hypothetical protein